MTIAHSIGHPYIHTGINCDGCGQIPIKGYRYWSQRNADTDLCGQCYYQQPRLEQEGFLKIERADNTRPFQIHYVECQGCGSAPIEGPRYRHKAHSDYDLCGTCYVEVTGPNNPSGQPAAAFEILDQNSTSSNRRRHQPTYHFQVHCKECQVSPICGPRYTSMKNFQYDLCLLCFDHLLVNNRITATQFRRIERPDSRSAVHVYLYSCSQCSATPICGPAYVSGTNPNNILCLMCFLMTKSEEQQVYSRVEPPRQVTATIALANTLPAAMLPLPANGVGTALVGQRPGSAGFQTTSHGPPQFHQPGGLGQPLQSSAPQFQQQQQPLQSMAPQFQQRQPQLVQPSVAPQFQQQPMQQSMAPQFQAQQPVPRQIGGQAMQPQQQAQAPGMTGQQQVTAAVGRSVGQQLVKGVFSLFSGGNSSSGGGGGGHRSDSD